MMFRLLARVKMVWLAMQSRKVGDVGGGNDFGL